MPRSARPIIDRIRERSEVNTDGCWIWQGMTVQGGYGRMVIGSRTDGTRRMVLAHRASYEAFREPISPGMTIDHLCRKPACVNPDHLEVVTMRENTMRGNTVTRRNAEKTCCPKCGGPFTTRPTGTRYCRPCNLAYLRDYNATRRRPTCSRLVGLR